MTEDLKLIVELFSQVTDGALYGGIAYLSFNLLTSAMPWVGGFFLLKLVLGHLPKFKVEVKEK
jgi:hypothetical protein